MNFSIILPSRERIELLTNLLQSVANTASDISNVEVLVGVDNDDTQTRDASVELIKKFPFAQFHFRNRSPMLNKDYINWMYDISVGRFIIVCNDDAEFKTPNWDQIALNKLNAYLADKPDGIVYGYISDAILNRYGMAYCCFPLVSRVSVTHIGWLMYPACPSWNADVICWKAYVAVGRVLDLSEIMIQHVSYHSGLRGRDPVSYNVENIARGGPGVDVNIQGEISRLHHAIHSTNR